MGAGGVIGRGGGCKEGGEFASCNDVHFLMYIFQGTDATVEDSFAPLGTPLLPWENPMGRGKHTTSNIRRSWGRTLRLLDQIGPPIKPISFLYEALYIFVNEPH